MTVFSTEINIDFGCMDRGDQIKILEELIDSMPDRDIAAVIIEHGTSDLVELLEPWVAENTPDDEAEDEEPNKAEEGEDK